MVPLRAPINIVFNEWVDHNSFESAYSISPEIENLKIKWHGKRVELKHDSPLSENTTYVVNLGTILKDIRNNNLRETSTFCFSTGTTIDSGMIWGIVYDNRQPASEREVWAYRASIHGKPYITKKPDYITWSGENGSFHFNFLPSDSYRVIAIDDMDGDGQIDIETEKISIPPMDVHSDNPVSMFNMMFGMQDTTRPELLYVESIDNQKVRLKFSKPLDLKSLDRSDVSFLGLNKEIKYSMPYIVDTENRVIEFGFESPVYSGEYMVSVSEIYDVPGNKIYQDTMKFEISESNDTLSPGIWAIEPIANATKVPLNGKLRIEFSEAVKGGVVYLQDTLGHQIEGTIEHPFPDEIIFRAHKQLKGLTKYLWKITSVSDFAGNFSKDTTYYRFTTLDPDTFGTLTGKIVTGFYPLKLEVVNLASQKVYKDELVDSLFSKDLFPGNYSIFIYQDADKNGKLSLGRLFPFSFCETFWAIPDTVNIRSRWETEIHLNLLGD